MGNRPRWSPQNPMVEDVLFSRKVTNVTCTVVPPPLVTVLNCTMPTDPLMVENPGRRAPRMNMFPQPPETTTRQATRRMDRRRFTAHLRTRVTESLHPLGGMDAIHKRAARWLSTANRISCQSSSRPVLSLAE